jgi:hypothetical protein
MSVEIPVGSVNVAIVSGWNGSAREYVTTMAYSTADDVTPVTFETTVGDFVDAMQLGIWNELYLNSGAKVKRVEATLMTDSGPLPYVQEIGWNGSYTHDSWPPAYATIVRKVTGLGGRRNRGRMYIPNCVFGNEDECDELGFLSTAHVIAMQGYVDDWFDAMTDKDLIPQLLHEDGTPGSSLASLVVNPHLALQKRRNRPA